MNKNKKTEAVIDFINKHPNEFNRTELERELKIPRSTLYDMIRREGLTDLVLSGSSFKGGQKMSEPTQAQQQALLEECAKFGIDVEDVKHFWHKSKRISMFVVAQNRPTYETVREKQIAEMVKHSPKYPSVKRNKITDKHLFIVDPADVHVGKLAVKSETGYSYDIATAVSMAEEGVTGLLQKAQGFPIDKIVLVAGNDILHCDTPTRTTTGGTHQDTDGQWHQAFIAARQLYVRLIEQLRLEAPVHVVFNPSNHDYMSGYMLTDSLYSWFHNAKDVTFDSSIIHRKCLKYGNSMIATTHGDGAKVNDMPLLMATEFPEIWATTKHRYIYQHHIHHRTKVQWQSVKDNIGITLRTLRSPSAPDGWHDRKGYTGAPRAIEGFLHHIENGEVARLF
jgi:hypothetical protein